MLRPDRDIICSSPGSVAAVDVDPVWDVIYSLPDAVASIDGENWLLCDLLLT